MNISFASPEDDRLLLAKRRGLVQRAYFLVGASDAEDVVHDAFERALRSQKVRPNRDPGPWLYRIARNAGFDALRARARESVLTAEPAEPDSVERTVVLRETAVELDGAMQALPAVQRRTLALHDLEGYSSREIAVLDGVSYHTVRTRLFRARRAMRDALVSVAA